MFTNINSTAAASTSDITMMYGVKGGGFYTNPTCLELGVKTLSNLRIGEKMRSVLDLIEELYPRYSSKVIRSAYSDEPRAIIEEDFIARKSDEVFIITTKKGGKVKDRRTLFLIEGEIRI